MNKIGCHVQRLTPEVLAWIELAQPPVVVWVDPDQKGVDEIRRRSPDTFIVGRRHEAGQNWLASWPKRVAHRAIYEPLQKLVTALIDRSVSGGSRAARKALGLLKSPFNAVHRRGWDIWQAVVGPETWADRCAAMARCDAWVCWNEPFGHDAADLFAAFDQWQVRFRQRMLHHGMEAVAFNFGTGNFTAAPDRVKVSEAFPLTCRSFKYFGIHEYFWPTMREGQIWHTLRFPFWHYDIGRDDVIFIVTECGVTQAVHRDRPDRGWRDGVLDAPTEVEHLTDWAWYNDSLCAFLYVLGCAAFNFGGYGWETFEYGDHPIRFRMAALEASGSPEPLPEEPPSQEEPMDIKVVDLEYKERDFEYARAKYGVAFRRAEVAPGQKVYRLTELWEKTGPSSLVTQVLDEHGDPMAGIDVAFYWPDAPDPPDPPTEIYPHDWHRNFKHGPTNENGDVGPGMGRGAYHGEGEGGPHAVWVRDPDIPSDICEKLGMLDGTPHDHLDQKFKLTTAGAESPTELPGDERFVLVDQAFQRQGDNRVLIRAAGPIFRDVLAHYRVEGGPIFEPRQPDTLTSFPPLTADYIPSPGETSRMFVVQLKRPDGTPVGNKWRCPYRTGSTGWWTLQVEWGAGADCETPQPPPPEPEPPPSEPPPLPEPPPAPGPDVGLAELCRRMAAAYQAKAAVEEVQAWLFEEMAERFE